MVQLIKSVIFLYSLLLIVGCAQKLPLVSHAHVGHALTAWRDTPGEQGLFIVAEEETATALDETKSAIAAGQNQGKRKDHLSNVLNALNPDLANKTKAPGYGAIRALNGATDHMVFAAESDDASENMKNMVHKFAEAQVGVLNRMKLAVEVTRLAQQSSGQEQQDLLLQLQNTLSGVIQGEDSDRDGRVGSGQEEYGLLQLREIISDGLKSEKPAYHPVEKKYLFGLIRLPTGGWAYQFNSSGKNERSDYYDTDMGYRY